MRRLLATISSAALVLTLVPTTFAQGNDPDKAQGSRTVRRVGNTDVMPSRRQLREQARNRQVSEAGSFWEYRLHIRKVQQDRTNANLYPDQRRARLIKKQKTQGHAIERLGDKILEKRQKSAPERAATIDFEPSNKRSRVGAVRIRATRDPCLAVGGTRRSRCYYELQRKKR